MNYKEIRTLCLSTRSWFSGAWVFFLMVQKRCTTDIKGRPSITPCARRTASAAQAFLEERAVQQALPQRSKYLDSCYRYRSWAGRLPIPHCNSVWVLQLNPPQAGRLIALASAIFDRLGVTGLQVEINAHRLPLAVPNIERPAQLLCCPQRRERADTCGVAGAQPMRILDCKESPVCRKS